MLATDLGIDADFWCADVYDAVEAVGGRTFDVVYTGIGALGWLPDSRRRREWSQPAASGRRAVPGRDHPMALAGIEDGMGHT